ncbi:hypothetical protein V8F20_008979 [Naviculisporaceae sp. PSN 640]
MAGSRARQLLALLKTFSLTDILFYALINLLTLPYHRFFTYNTLRPAQLLQSHANLAELSSTYSSAPSRHLLHCTLVAWRSRKKDELNFSIIAATVITAIVTASFSWGNVESSIWVGPAFWYASLSMAICGIFLGAQQLSVLSLLGELPVLKEEKDGKEGKKNKKKAKGKGVSAGVLKRHLRQILYEFQEVKQTVRDEEVRQDRQEETKWNISWRSIFTWQCPMMFIAYSTLFYIVGLSVVVLTPLIKEDWGDNSYVAVAYAASTGVAWGLFAFCSLGGYNEIEMHQREEDEDEDEEHPDVGTRDDPDSKTAGTIDTGVEISAAAADR